MPAPTDIVRRFTTIRALSCVPLAMMLAVLLMAAAGAPLVGQSSAAVTGSTITVTGSVDAEIHLDASGCTSVAALDLDQIVPDDPARETASNCDVSFGTTNHLPGTDLTVQEDPAAPATPTDALKCIAASCTGDSVADYSGTGMPAAPASAFAMRLHTTAAGTTPGPGWSRSADVTGDMHALAGPSTPCRTSAIGDGSCGFRFAAMATSANDQPGDYQALAQFVVLPR